MEPKIVSGAGGAFTGVDTLTGPIKTIPKKAKGDMDGWLSRNARSGVHLTRAERLSLQGGELSFIYNYSPVARWERRCQNFGIFLIPEAPSIGSKILDVETGEIREATAEDVAGPYRLSPPIVLNNSYVRTHDGGDGKIIPRIEYGEDIAADIVGNSTRYPADLVKGKDLSKRGVFICYGKPFEDQPVAVQNQLLQEAHAGHFSWCRDMVNQGDRLFERSKLTGKGGPLEQHKKCANYLAQFDPKIADRPWVTNRGTLFGAVELKDCTWCQSSIKAKAVICPVCHHDQREDPNAPVPVPKGKGKETSADAV